MPSIRSGAVASDPTNRWQFGHFVSVLTPAAWAIVLIGTATIGRSQAQPQTGESAPSSAGAHAISGTGEPGAMVRLHLYSDRNAIPELRHETTIDSDGRFSIDNLPTVGGTAQLVLSASKSGFSSVIRDVTGPGQPQFDLQMNSSTAALSGTVTDSNGNPIADAVVSTQHRQTHPIPSVQTAKTDANGRFSIVDLAPKSGVQRSPDGRGYGVTWFISVTHPDHPVTIAEYSQIPQEVNVTLYPPAIVEGQVIDLVTGDTIPGVEVRAQGIARSHSFTAKTDADGVYQLRMTRDNYNIWAVAADRMPLAIEALDVTPGRRLVGRDIHMAQGGFVVGKVIDPATDRPVDGSAAQMDVVHKGPARPMIGAAVARAEVMADGTYRLHVAPGRNYVSLRNGLAASVELLVGDGQTVEHDFILGSKASASNEQDAPGNSYNRHRRLRRQILLDARRGVVGQVNSSTHGPDAPTLRRQTQVGILLTELEDNVMGNITTQGVWENRVRKLVEIGPDAMPELIGELDRTSDEWMLRSLGFILRAIDDKRAVPGLIRAIPRTLHVIHDPESPNVDLTRQVRGTDESQIRFMTQHALDPSNEGTEYVIGRSLREICAALRSLTGQDFGEEELCDMFSFETEDTPSFPAQKRATIVNFHRVAERWAQWWEEHAHEFTNDPSFHQVRLPALPDPEPAESIRSETRLISSTEISNDMLGSLRGDPTAPIFFDLDSGRRASLPERWRSGKFSENNLKDIREWAAKEGFDLMGDETPEEGKLPVFVLRPIGLSTWELPKTRWKTEIDNTSVASLKQEGRMNQRDDLLHVDATSNELKPREIATFFYITREGTPGILYVGVEVHNGGGKPEDEPVDDCELDPVDYSSRIGRRFGLGILAEAR